MDPGNACRLCGKIIGGNTGSMAKHQSTWQCAARRPKKVSSIATPHKRPRQMTAESEECQQSAEFFDGGVDECLPSSPEPSLEAETIVPAPVPRPHDPDHAVRKRMRVRFLDILRLNARRDEAALVSNGPIMSTDVPESQYDHDDDLSGASSEEELDRREDGDEVDRRTRTREEYENEYEHAVKVLREYVQRVFNPAQGPGLPAAKRKEVIEIVQLALSAGKAYPDITVLDLFPDSGGASKSGSIASIDHQFRKHMAALIQDDGWIGQDFSVKGGTAICYWNTRAIDALAVKVGHLIEVVDGRSRWDGQYFGHPTSGAFMKEFSALLQRQRRAYGDWDPDGDLPILMTYFSDATLLANKGSMTAHPVVVGIGNVPPSSYTDTFVTVGYLDPKICFEEGLDDDDAAQVKRALVAKQVGSMMEQFKRCSFLGHNVVGQDGKSYRMFTGLFDCAIDNPEVSLLLGHKTGYCGLCHWKTNLGTAQRRSESRTRDVVDLIRKAGRKTDCKALMEHYGCHPQPSGLWGFNGSCSLNHLPDYLPPRLATAVRASIQPSTATFMDVHAVVSTERLHEIDVGITVNVRDTVFNILRSTLSEKEIEEINDGLWNCLSYESRWQGLVHPPKKRETAVLRGYLGGITRVEASEHRTMLQVLVPVCCRFLGTNHPVTRMYALYVKYYATRERRLTWSTSHSRASLSDTDRLFQLVLDRLQQYQKIDDKTGNPKVLDTPKVHAQQHFAEAVVRAGMTTITTGEAGEANNAKVKAPYLGRRTNRQTEYVSEQLARRQREAEATSRLQIRLPPPEKGRAYDTSVLIAARTDVCSLTKHKNVRGPNNTNTYEIMQFVDKAVGTSKNPREMAKVDLTSAKGYFDDLTIAQDPEAAKMKISDEEKHMRLLFGAPLVGRCFLEELSHYFLGTGNAEDFKRASDPVIEVKVVTNAVCPSVTFGDNRSEARSRTLHRLRANPRFRVSRKSAKGRGPGRFGIWMDFVAIAAEQPHQGDDLYYARLLLLFHAQDPATGTWTQMAFVRYLSRTESKSDEERRWAKTEDEPLLTKLKYSVRTKRGKQTWWYGVVLAQSIVRKIHVVAGNQSASDSLLKSRGEETHRQIDKEAVFFINHYVWEAKASNRYQIEGETDLNQT